MTYPNWETSFNPEVAYIAYFQNGRQWKCINPKINHIFSRNWTSKTDGGKILVSLGYAYIFGYMGSTSAIMDQNGHQPQNNRSSN